MKWIVLGSALGELAVGVAVAIFPTTVAGLLLAASVEGTGIAVARMAGIAVAALALAWWISVGRVAEPDWRETAPSYLVYNFCIGLLFVAHAWSAEPLPTVPVAVAAAHLSAGCAFLALVSRGRSI